MSSYNLDNCQSKQFAYNNVDVRTADVLTPSETPSATAKAVSSSKYLKAAQHLLDEVVNVRNALMGKNQRNATVKDSTEIDPGSKSEDSDHPESGSSLNPQESNNSQTLLSASEKQDLHSKISKLLTMLDEVDKRYKQYYHQMQIVVSSFEVVAGYGAARPYTALALQTISRHFRCLRDSISDQVQETRKSLGEQDASGNGKGVGISRLRFVDQQIKQHRNFHQLGIMQQHAWRPQRGLPETSVTVLRAWLFEHFLHPYPKDSDKIMLARQTGLTRSQVSNWFINARVRLWKPMVEEMYKEETADAKMDSNAAEKTPNTRPLENTGEDLGQNTISTDCHNTGQLFDSNAEVEPYASEPSQADWSELERYDNGRGVSLTLGLQHCDGGGSMPMAVEAGHGYMPMRGDGMYNETIQPLEEEFDFMESGNAHHQLGGASRLLHDFVV